jgi:hypothetical protein
MRRLTMSGCALLVIGVAGGRTAKGQAPPSVASPRSMIQYDSVVATRRREVRPGTAILTRAGSSHGLRQLGGEDLVILISYQQAIR